MENKLKFEKSKNNLFRFNYSKNIDFKNGHGKDKQSQFTINSFMNSNYSHMYDNTNFTTSTNWKNDSANKNNIYDLSTSLLNTKKDSLNHLKFTERIKELKLKEKNSKSNDLNNPSLVQTIKNLKEQKNINPSKSLSLLKLEKKSENTIREIIQLEKDKLADIEKFRFFSPNAQIGKKISLKNVTDSKKDQKIEKLKELKEEEKKKFPIFSPLSEGKLSNNKLNRNFSSANFKQVELEHLNDENELKKSKIKIRKNNSTKLKLPNVRNKDKDKDKNSRKNYTNFKIELEEKMMEKENKDKNKHKFSSKKNEKNKKNVKTHYSQDNLFKNKESYQESNKLRKSFSNFNINFEEKLEKIEEIEESKKSNIKKEEKEITEKTQKNKKTVTIKEEVEIAEKVNKNDINKGEFRLLKEEKETETENEEEKDKKNTTSEKEKKPKKKKKIDVIDFKRKRQKTADTIKRSVNKICNNQMDINNNLLKPLITRDNKKSEIKLFKKFFKSDDENLDLKINKMFYESQKLTEKEKRELEENEKALGLNEIDETKRRQSTKFKTERKYSIWRKNSVQDLEIIEEEKVKEKDKPKIEKEKFRRQNTRRQNDKENENKLKKIKEATKEKRFSLHEQIMDSFVLETESQILELDDENDNDQETDLKLERNRRYTESFGQKVSDKMISTKEDIRKVNDTRKGSKLSIFNRKGMKKRLGTMVEINPAEIKSVYNMDRKLIDIRRPPASSLIPLKKLCTVNMDNLNFVRNFNFSYENEKIKAREKINEFYYEEDKITSVNSKNMINNTNKFFNTLQYVNVNNSSIIKPKEKQEEKFFSKRKKSNTYKLELFNNVRNNEKQQKKLEKKLKKMKMQEDNLNKFTKTERFDFHTNIIKGMQHYIDMKREDDILKYDYITKIDNGLVFKETLKENIMHKLIPGNYIIQNQPQKLEVYQPNFIQTKFCMGKNQIAGKPIVKESDHSLKEYCNYYNKRGEQAREKNAFSIMNII